MSSEFVQVNVGGVFYSLAVSDFHKYPGCFFECMIKKEWSESSSEVKDINRDGTIFKYVNAFLVCGHLPRDSRGLIDIDVETLQRIKEEADFFGLEALAKECDLSHKNTSPTDMNSFLTIRKYIQHVKDHQGDENGSIEVDYQMTLPSALMQCLSEVYSPFCLSGWFKQYALYRCPPLFKSSTIEKLNIEELLAEATQSAFGRGTETVTDTDVRNSFEIEASKLNQDTLRAIRSCTKVAALAPHLNLDVRPYKLVIYKEGGHFDAHRDTVRGEGHIGTLVIILNSEYTGGELEVSHSGRTESITGEFHWVAMYGDCLHKINPVTSGTRVSLIYDIYGTSRWVEHLPALLKFAAEEKALEDAANGVAGKSTSTTLDVTDATGADAAAEVDEEEEEDDEEEEEEEEEEEDDWMDEDEEEDSVDAAPRWYSNRCTPKPGRARGMGEIDTEFQAAMFAALDEEELGPEEDKFDAVIIALQHLYPECQTSPAFLKGGDRALYDLLSEQYDVEVVVATIYREMHPAIQDTVKGSLFTPALIHRALNRVAYKPVLVPPTISGEAGKSADAVEGVDGGPIKKQRLAGPDPTSATTPVPAVPNSLPPRNKIKLVISTQLDPDSLLDYTPYIEHTGNESQSEETVYIVAGLQVRKKVQVV